MRIEKFTKSEVEDYRVRRSFLTRLPPGSPAAGWRGPSPFLEVCQHSLSVPEAF
jgi:hypothetical protein